MWQAFSISILFFIFCQPAFSNETKLEKIEKGQIDPKLRIESHKADSEVLERVKHFPYYVGEEIKFRAYHETAISKVLAGHCAMKIKELRKVAGRWAMKFRLEATSAEWYDWAFVLKDYVEGYFDIDKNQTLFLDLNKKENDYRQSKQIEFNYSERMIIERDDTNGKKKYKQYVLPKEVVDAYSIVFLIRRYDLNGSNDINYNIYADGKVYALSARVEGHPEIEHHGKRVATHKVKVLTKVQGALEQRGGIFVYFTKDKFKKPIRVEGDVKIGQFVLEMEDQKASH